MSTPAQLRDTKAQRETAGGGKVRLMWARVERVGEEEKEERQRGRGKLITNNGRAGGGGWLYVCLFACLFVVPGKGEQMTVR